MVPDLTISLLTPFPSQTLNLYTYARNNPTSLTDPSGLVYCDAEGNCMTDADYAALYFLNQTLDLGLDLSQIQWVQTYYTTGTAVPGQDLPYSPALYNPLTYQVPTGTGTQPGGAANNAPYQIAEIIGQLQSCSNASAQSAGNDLAEMQASGHIQITPSSSPYAGNTTTPLGAIFGLQTPTIQINSDFTNDASTLVHEWIHKTQTYGNPLGMAAVGANKAQAAFDPQGEGFLDRQADRIAAKILAPCKISQ